MSNDIFIAILNMDITASYVALAIIAIRVFLKKAPKFFLYVLWLPVFIRLVLPFSFSSGVSFLNMIKPGAQTSWGGMEYIPRNIGFMQKPIVDVGISGINSSVNSSLPAATPFSSVNPMQIVLVFYEIIWIIGIVLLLLYCIFSCWKVIEKVKTATVLKDRIFESDRIATPFVFGFIKPKIFIPLGLSENELTYILAHERTHIKRMDHIIKPIAFLIVIMHWFNPLMWISFILMTKDMEMSCDENVIKKMGNDIKGNYANSLLSFSIKRSRLIMGSPLAFGESNIKSRIKNILAYRKPAMGIMAVITVILAALIMVLIANPQNDQLNTSKINTYSSKDARNSFIKDSTEVVSLKSPMTNEDIMKKYVTDFLTKGYSKHYIINNINFRFDENKATGAKFEAIIFATMNSNVPPGDPEAVPYIQEAKEKAQRETSPETKKVLQNVYETMVKEYGKPFDSNYNFKITADLVNGKIDEKTIKLFIVQDDGKSYAPAGEILPKDN